MSAAASSGIKRRIAGVSKGLSAAAGLPQLFPECPAQPRRCAGNAPKPPLNPAVCPGDILAMRDIGVDESEELPLILRPLVDDGGGAAVGALAPEPLRLAVLQAVRDATPALMQLQVGG